MDPIALSDEMKCFQAIESGNLDTFIKCKESGLELTVSMFERAIEAGNVNILEKLAEYDCEWPSEMPLRIIKYGKEEKRIGMLDWLKSRNYPFDIMPDAFLTIATLNGCTDILLWADDNGIKYDPTLPNNKCKKYMYDLLVSKYDE